MKRFYIGLGFTYIFFFLFQCRPLPEKKLSQFKLPYSYEVKDDSLRISIHNTLACPLRMSARSDLDSINQLLKADFPMVFPAFTDSNFIYPLKGLEKEIDLWFPAMFGDTAVKIIPQKISLPFPSGQKVKIMQGYNGSFSHTSLYARYALDFALQVGDTICSAADGFVIGVIEGYKYGGSSRKWRDYANYITLYHPESKLYTQYVHLDHEGSLVEVGDEVKMGEAIAISGLTGFTSKEHLHFNVLRPSKEGMESFKIEFIEGYSGEKLKEGTWVEKK
ncbi:MAG: peptidoglycan DD-metalloendopeptidase family protein [Bacteroidota bacterium]